MSNRFFFDRRRGNDRRKSLEQRQNPRLDLSYRRRRSGDDRRHTTRSKAEDAYASGVIDIGRKKSPGLVKH